MTGHGKGENVLEKEAQIKKFVLFNVRFPNDVSKLWLFLQLMFLYITKFIIATTDQTKLQIFREGC